MIFTVICVAISSVYRRLCFLSQVHAHTQRKPVIMETVPRLRREQHHTAELALCLPAHHRSNEQNNTQQMELIHRTRLQPLQPTRSCHTASGYCRLHTHTHTHHDLFQSNLHNKSSMLKIHSNENELFNKYILIYYLATLAKLPKLVHCTSVST